VLEVRDNGAGAPIELAEGIGTRNTRTPFGKQALRAGSCLLGNCRWRAGLSLCRIQCEVGRRMRAAIVTMSVSASAIRALLRSDGEVTWRARR